MHVILLSGGSGKRLWPLSNSVRSKQFIKLFPRKLKDGTEEYESMVQRMYRQIRSVDPDATVTVATEKSQVSQLRNQLDDAVEISVEPCRRDTFPAIVLSVAYLHDVQGLSDEEAVVVCPVDPYVDERYFVLLKKLSDLAKEDSCNLTLMGVEPTYPSEKYGYIIPASLNEVSPVKTFKEKPDEKTAQKYIEQGALWNAGVFAFKIGYLLQKAKELISFTDFDDLLSRYSELDKISFDYAVVEKESSIQVVRFSGSWKDMGTWNTLTEAMEVPVVGKGTLNSTCENVHVVNELDMPILVMGLKNAVVAASPEGILVSDKEQSSYIKPYVDALDQQVKFAEKSWGSFRVLDVEKSSMTLLVTLKEGHQMNYHSHEHRDEIWNIISGEGRTIVDGMEQKVHPGDVVTMQAGCRHTIVADTDMKLIEVQLGEEISVQDKQKFDLEI